MLSTLLAFWFFHFEQLSLYASSCNAKIECRLYPQLSSQLSVMYILWDKRDLYPQKATALLIFCCIFCYASDYGIFCRMIRIWFLWNRDKWVFTLCLVIAQKWCVFDILTYFCYWCFSIWKLCIKIVCFCNCSLYNNIYYRLDF